MSGVKRYEDGLYENMVKMGIQVSKTYRPMGNVMGNTVVSWFMTYKGDADIVHATSQTIAPVIYIRRPKRFVITVHDLIPLVYPSVLGRNPSMRLQWMLTPKALKKADAIIAISEFTKKEVLRLTGVDEQKVHTVHHAAVKYHPMGRRECKRRLELDADEKHILVVASNNQNKRMDITRKVFENIRKYRKDVRLIKIGYGEKLSGEGIINMGWVAEKDMPILFNSADTFLCTAEYEGFGAPILEAMSCGVPVVVSNKASIPEVVGGYGNMVDMDKPDMIEQFVDKILSSIDIGLDERAIEQSKRFSWEKTAEETIRVYRDV
jgi:glycosyltransferase involved in cell wall biosynthesis